MRAFCLLFLFAPIVASAQGPVYSGISCQAVKKSAVGDLPAFCAAPDLDKKRLIDYGFQLEVLSGQCQEKPLSAKLTEAVRAKVQQDERGRCASVAAELVRGI